MRHALWILTALTWGQEWPGYLNGPAHTSYAPGETLLHRGNVAQLTELWSRQMGASIASGITVSGGTLYFGTWDGYFSAVNAGDGAVLWRQFIGMASEPAEAVCMPAIGVSAQAVVTEDTVYAGGGDAAVYALRRSSGEILWRVPLADPDSGAYLWSSLTYANGVIYIGIASLGDCPVARGGLARIDTADPEHPLVRYFVPDGELGAGVWSTPALDEEAGLLYVTTGNAGTQDAASGNYGNALLVVDAATLEVRQSWFLPPGPADEDMDWGSSPVLFDAPDGTPLVAANGKDGRSYAFTRPDLTSVWVTQLATSCAAPEAGCGSISTPAFDGRALFSGAGHSDAGDASGSIYALDPATGSVLWASFEDAPVLAPVTVTPGLVFAPTTGGLVALDAETGAKLWDDGKRFAMYGQAAVAGGVVYSGYVNGALVARSTQPAPAERLGAYPSALVFRTTVGGEAAAAQPLHTGMTAAARSTAGWLRVEPGAGPAQFRARADAEDRGPGVHRAEVSLNAGALEVPARLVVNPKPVLGTPGGTLAPGALFTLDGGVFASEEAAAAVLPWPVRLGGVQVTLNGIPAALEFAGTDTVRGQLPYGAAPGPGELRLSSNGVTAAAAVDVAETAPVILSVKPGDPLLVIFTGYGAVDAPLLAGAPAPQTDTPVPRAQVTATLGGRAAQAFGATLQPGTAGRAQVQVKAPAGLSGAQPLILSVGGAASPPVMVELP